MIPSSRGSLTFRPARCRGGTGEWAGASSNVGRHPAAAQPLDRRIFRMNRSFFPAVALISLLGLLNGPAARAQAPTISPPTTSTPVFPINQSQTFRYTDADGMGTITF